MLLPHRKFEEDESGFGLSRQRLIKTERCEKTVVFQSGRKRRKRCCARFNPLRFSLMKKNSNVVDVGARWDNRRQGPCGRMLKNFVRRMSTFQMCQDGCLLLVLGFECCDFFSCLVSPKGQTVVNAIWAKLLQNALLCRSCALWGGSNFQITAEMLPRERHSLEEKYLQLTCPSGPILSFSWIEPLWNFLILPPNWLPSCLIEGCVLFDQTSCPVFFSLKWHPLICLPWWTQAQSSHQAHGHAMSWLDV